MYLKKKSKDIADGTDRERVVDYFDLMEFCRGL